MIKTFKVQAEYNDLMYVVLQVDMDKLTLEAATQINNFCSRDERIESEDGDVVRAVVRLYGARAIRKMLYQGGACFKAHNPLAIKHWTTALQGLLANIRCDVFDHGISVVEAQIEIPDFDSVELLDITAQCA